MVLPDIANIISVAVSTVVSTSLKELGERLTRKFAEVQRQCILNKYDNDRMDQHSRRENLRNFGIDEEVNETDDVLEPKIIIELAGDIGVELKPDDISVPHRMGKSKEVSRPVIVRFCHRKKRTKLCAIKKNKG
ncbi:hypothetical protein E2C01_074965 [Portunus trituberculatus]|uniref:Uncharacterized protein n=1 Tax=Portunus trituberculatus TaxID=210409 RepID=A0A5B7IFN7_PORTR|nr:hypothetical protein [Portunus trituberculatus]